MADSNAHETDNDLVENGHVDERSETITDCEDATTEQNSLEQFILHHYEQQKKINAVNSSIDDEQMDRFLEKALSESKRMNKEVIKSQKRMQALRAEFGDEVISSWRREHAAEVLSPEQASRVEDSIML